MVEYGEDYTDAATVIEGMKTAYTVGKGYEKEVVEPEEATEVSQEGDAEAKEGDAEAKEGDAEAKEGEKDGQQDENERADEFGRPADQAKASETAETSDADTSFGATIMMLKRPDAG